jgi:hypothetical protein
MYAKLPIVVGPVNDGFALETVSSVLEEWFSAVTVAPIAPLRVTPVEPAPPPESVVMAPVWPNAPENVIDPAVPSSSMKSVPVPFVAAE